MVHGGKDDIVPESHVAALVKKLSSQRGIVIDYKIVPDANHYFNEKIDAVTTHVERYLDRTLSSKKVPA
jgi:alpha/beta superfamily hydrolase